MKRQRISTFPLDKPFQKQPLDTTVSQVSVRVIANMFEYTEVIGTGTVVGSHAVLTAKHVVQAIIDSYGFNKEGMLGSSIQVLQTFGQDFFLWDVFSAYLHPVADIALLHLSGNPGMSRLDLPANWASCRIEPFSPEILERVAAFGYRRSKISATVDEAGTKHIVLDDEPMMSVGLVHESHPFRRDQMMPFPCYRVSARFDRGMSGGPVFDETGALCGIVCSGYDTEDEPISYVSTLWPFFAMPIAIDRGDAFPRGIHYQALELAFGRQVTVTDQGRLLAHFSNPVVRAVIGGHYRPG